MNKQDILNEVFNSNMIIHNTKTRHSVSNSQMVKYKLLFENLLQIIDDIKLTKYEEALKYIEVVTNGGEGMIMQINTLGELLSKINLIKEEVQNG